MSERFPNELSPEDVQLGLAERGILLIDVREPSEFAAERIHGALLFPLSTFDPAALPDVGERAIVLHCGSGKRSAMALTRCLEAGFKQVAHMTGGLMAWKNAGYPVISIDPETGKVRDAR
jgi:rhodanese-related sulfurtransferase